MYTKSFQYNLKYFYLLLDFFNCWSDLHVAGFTYFSCVSWSFSLKPHLSWFWRQAVCSLSHSSGTLNVWSRKSFFLKIISIYTIIHSRFLFAAYFSSLWRVCSKTCVSPKFLYHLSFETNCLIFSRLIKSSFLWTCVLCFSACSPSIQNHNTQQETTCAKANPDYKSTDCYYQMKGWWLTRHWKWTDLAPVGCHLVSWLKSSVLTMNHRCLSV